MNGQFQRQPNPQQMQQNLHSHQGGIHIIQQDRARASRLQNLQPPAYYPEAQQTRGGSAGDVIKSAVFCGTVGLVLLGPAGLIIGGVVGGLLGKTSGR
jgi:hypothetical protein